MCWKHHFSSICFYEERLNLPWLCIGTELQTRSAQVNVLGSRFRSFFTVLGYTLIRLQRRLELLLLGSGEDMRWRASPEESVILTRQTKKRDCKGSAGNISAGNRFWLRAWWGGTCRAVIWVRKVSGRSLSPVMPRLEHRSFRPWPVGGRETQRQDILLPLAHKNFLFMVPKFRLLSGAGRAGAAILSHLSSMLKLQSRF